MNKNHKTLLLRAGSIVCLTLFALPVGLRADDPIRVVATTTDLAYIAERIVGENGEAIALLSGAADPHHARARPDYIVKLNRADVFVQVGLDLEEGWGPPLLRSARNPSIRPGSEGHCDPSSQIQVLDVPDSEVNRSMGHVHARGNPHYWTDPVNAALIARCVRDALKRVDPSRGTSYDANYRAFHAELRQLTLEQRELFAPYSGLKVAVYHREFSYLSARFGFEVVASIEEKPGVLPSAAYLERVSEEMKREGVRIILIAPYNNRRFAESVAERIEGEVLVMPLSVGAEPEVLTYADTITVMLSRLRAAADRYR